MNLLTNGFVNNSGRLFGSSEQFEAGIVEMPLRGFVQVGPESQYPWLADFGCDPQLATQANALIEPFKSISVLGK